MTEFWSDRAPWIKVGHGEDCLRVGDQADGLLLDAHLGDGGSAVVFRALDSTGMRFAMKFLTEDFENHLQADHPGDDRIGAYLGTELSRTRQVNSEHVVDVLRASPVPRQSYLVMEYLEGVTLLDYLREHLLREDFPLTVETALALLYQVACGLRDLHVGGYCHADIKPKNVYVTYRDDQPRSRHNPRIAAVLIDLGATERVNDGATRMVRQFTREYSHPSLDPQAPRCITDDWYGFGVVAAETLLVATGYLREPTHVGSPGSSGVLDHMHRGLPTLRGTVPSDIITLVLACLSGGRPSPVQQELSVRTETAEDSISLVRRWDAALRDLTGQTGLDVVLEAPRPPTDTVPAVQVLPVVCTNSGEFTAVFGEDIIPPGSEPTEVHDQGTGMKPASTTPHRSPAPEPARPTEYVHASGPGQAADHPDIPPGPSPGRETRVHDPHRPHDGLDGLHWRTEDPTQWSVRDILKASTAPVPYDGGRRSFAEFAHRSGLHALGFIAVCFLTSLFVVFLVTLGIAALIGR